MLPTSSAALAASWSNLLRHLLSCRLQWRETWEAENPIPRTEEQWHQFAREITKRTERYLDEGYGHCVFKHPDLAEQMGHSLIHFQNERHFTSSFTVMPNHVHLTIKPIDGFELEDIMESVKGYVSRYVNAGIPQHQQVRWIDPGWRDIGWGFRGLPGQVTQYDGLPMPGLSRCFKFCYFPSFA